MEQMEQIDGFMFFRSYYEAIRQLPNPADRCALYDAVCAYAFGQEEPEFTTFVSSLWTLILPTLHISMRRAAAAQKKKLKRQELKLGQSEDNVGTNLEQTWNKVGTKSEQVPTKEEEEEEKEKEVEKEEEKKVEGEEKAEGKLEIPTPQENNGKGESYSTQKVNNISLSGNDALARPPKKEQILEYCRSHGLSVDPQRFFNYYEARGWRLPSGPVKNWQACLESWEGNRFSDAAGKSAKTVNQQHYTLGEDELYAIEKMKRMDQKS